MKYPEPVELDDKGLEEIEVARRIGRAIAAQHPGSQISESLEECEGLRIVKIKASNPGGDWALYLKWPADKAASVLLREGLEGAMRHFIGRWESRLTHVMRGAQATNANGDTMELEQALIAIAGLMAKVKKGREKFIFIGNGGSAGIASHMAEDFTKNGGVRSVTFNDASLITCYANDYGWEQAFARAVDHHALAGDVVVAISSSGKSANIRNAVEAAQAKAVGTVTLSGFEPDNPLRSMGLINLWVPSQQYGFVETAHAALLHMVLDIVNGWAGAP